MLQLNLTTTLEEITLVLRGAFRAPVKLGLEDFDSRLDDSYGIETDTKGLSAIILLKFCIEKIRPISRNITFCSCTHL